MKYVVKTGIGLMTALLMIACSADTQPSLSSLPPFSTRAPQDSPTASAEMVIQQKDISTNHVITEQDHGQVFTYRMTSRFSVELDDALHPKSDLQCLPEPIFGYISNGSNGGSGYPIRYEMGRVGECELVNGDFWVKIVGAP